MKLIEGIANFFGSCCRTLKDTFRGWGRLEYFFFSVMIIYLGIMGYINYIHSIYMEERQICKIIKSVGECSRGGTCGVIYEDGSKGMIYLPNPGERHCFYVMVDKRD